MKHVILVLECDLSLTTGYSINEREAARALLDRYPDTVTVLAPSPQLPESFHDPRIVYLPNHRRHRPLLYLRFLHAAWRRLRKLVRDKRAGGVAFRLGVWPILPILARRRKLPVLLKTLSGYSLYQREDKRLAFRLLSGVLRPFFRRAVTGSAGADTPSHEIVAWLQEQFQLDAGRATVLPNGVNVERFRPTNSLPLTRRHGLDRFEHRLGYVGAMDTIRHLETALDALERLADLPGLGLVLVGDGPHLGPLRERAASRGLGERILFLGLQPYEDVPALIGSFDVAFDLTSVPMTVGGETRQASFSQKIPQYLACGVPTVATRSADTAFLEEADIGRTVDPRSAREMAEAVRTLLRRPADTKRIHRYAVDRFSYHALAEQRMSYWQSRLGAS